MGQNTGRKLNARTNLARLRESLRLPQGKLNAEEMAKFLGVPFKTYEAWERGVNPLPKKVALACQTMLGVSAAWVSSTDLDAPAVEPDGTPWGLHSYPKASKPTQGHHADVVVLKAFGYLDAIGASAAAKGREREFAAELGSMVQTLSEKYGVDAATLRLAVMQLSGPIEARLREARDQKLDEWVKSADFHRLNEGEPMKYKTPGGIEPIQLPPGLAAKALVPRSSDEPPPGRAVSASGVEFKLLPAMQRRAEWEARKVARKPTKAEAPTPPAAKPAGKRAGRLKVG